MSRAAFSVPTFLVLLAAPAVLTGQAICSAPHSSPMLAQGGGVGTLPPGSGAVQLSVFSQQADDHFDEFGTREPFFLDSETSTTSLYATAAVGVAWGVDVWAQAAVHRLRITAGGGETRRTGLGDVRVAARASAELLGSSAPVAVRFGIKIPGSSFPVDARILPLTEGQTDLEMSVETGRSVAGGAFYLLGWAGYRWRLASEVQARDPGNELFGHAAVGGSRGAFRWELGVDALRGAPPFVQGLELVNEQRRLVQFTPDIALSVGSGEVDLALQLPVSGRNLPSDPSVSMGYRFSW